MRVFYKRKENGGKNNITPIEWKGFGDFSSISTHAEMNAIISYLKRTNQYIGRRKYQGKKKFTGKIPKTMYIVSFYKGKWRNSRPCDHCLYLLNYYGIKKVVYTTGLDDPALFFCSERVNKMEYLGVSKGNR
jgi:deoxycytidylate deaminase